MTASPRDASIHRRTAVPPIAVTMGDPAGIGPDITLTSWLERSRARRCRPSCSMATRRRCERGRARWVVDVPIAAVDGLEQAPAAFRRCAAGPGRCRSPVGSRAPMRASSPPSRRRQRPWLGGEALALVTNPIAKRSLERVPLPYPGHTEFLAELAARHGARHRPARS